MKKDGFENGFSGGPVYDQDDIDRQIAETHKKASSKDRAEDSSLTPGELKTAEQAAELKSPETPTHEKKLGAGFTGKGGGSARSNKTKGVMILVAGGAGGLVVLAGLMILLLASLKIPHLGENIASWQLARTARIARLNISSINSERAWLDSMTDGAYSGARDRFSRLRGATWGKLDQYRPKKVFRNLGTEGILDFKYDEPRGIFSRQRLTHVVIDGEEIPINNRRVGRYFSNRGEVIRFSNELDAKLEVALHDHRGWVRSKVAKNIREAAGINLHWWEDAGRTFKGKTTAEADVIQLRESNEKIANGTQTDSTNDVIDDASKAGQEQLDEELRDEDSARRIAQTGDIPDSVSNSIDEVIDAPSLNAATNFASATSTIFAIAQPLCTIYEGSIVNAGPTIDAQEKALTRQFYAVASAGDQQKAGDTSAEAVGAMNRKLSNISDSLPLKRASGAPADELTPTQRSPQSTPTGDFTFLNVLFGNDNAFINAVIDRADTVCPAVNNVWIGAAAGAGEVALSVALCATGAGCAATAGKEAAKLTVRQSVGLMVRRIFTRQTARRIFGEAVAVASATFLARMAVMSKMNAEFNGISRDTEAAEQADMGGNVHAQEINRIGMYGRPMTGEEQAYDIEQTKTQLAQREAQKGAFQRYFAISNPSSLVSRFSYALPASAGQNYLNGIGSYFSNGSGLSIKNIGELVFRKAGAQDSSSAQEQNYNIIQWGFTSDEIDLIETNESYLPLRNQEALESSGRLEDIESEYGACYTESMGTLISEGHIVRNSSGDIDPSQGKCAPNNLGTANDNYGENMVFRWRLSKSYETSLDQLEEIQNPEEEGSDASSGGPLPDGVVGPEDVVDILPWLAPGRGCYEGIADQTRQMLQAAQDAGVVLSGTCWRSNERQIQLRRDHCGTSNYDIYEKPSGECSPPTAIPGSSEHEKGLAIDFENCGTGSACFNWLSANAARYGFFNLPSESWHWSRDGS